MSNLPNADSLILQAIDATSPTYERGTQIPDDLLSRLPFALVRRFGGAAVDLRFLDRATVDVQAWADTRRGAWDVVDAVRTVFIDAAHNQTTFPLGHIARCVEVIGPSELRSVDQADGVWRFQASYSLFLRPAPA